MVFQIGTYSGMVFFIHTQTGIPNPKIKQDDKIKDAVVAHNAQIAKIRAKVPNNMRRGFKSPRLWAMTKKAKTDIK